MKGVGLGALLVSLGIVAGCGSSDAPLTSAAPSGFSEVEETESYPASTLYSYMNGGAELLLEYHVVNLTVKRYEAGSSRYVVELFQMKDEESAAALYTFMRRPGKQVTLSEGLPASVSESEVLTSRGHYYLACRNEDPMAKDITGVRNLASQVVGRIPGKSSVEKLFLPLPPQDRESGSEVALRGPLGLNSRDWLSGVPRQGFRSGALARYRVGEKSVEVFLAEYASDQEAAEIPGQLAQSDLIVLRHGRRAVVLKRPEDVLESDAKALADRIARSWAPS